MKVNIYNIDKFIEVNNLKEVTDPVLLERDKTPTSGGLFSYEIFGRLGSESRKTTFAYIDLKGHYFHPLVYKNLKRLDRKIEDCVMGKDNFRIDQSGSLVVSDNGETGIDFLYKNWDKLKFKKTDSNERNERVKMIESLKKDEIFVSKFIVMPPSYRDINLLNASSGVLGHDEINDFYAKLLRLVASNSVNDEDISGFDFMGNMTKSSIQLLLLDIYNYFLNYIKGKDGLFRQTVMGKSIDYGARLVISSAQFNKESYKDMLVDFEHTGVPLAQAITLFFPFVIKYVQDFFEQNLLTLTKGISYNDKKLIKIEDFSGQFSHEKIKKYIKRYIKSPSERFAPIYATHGNDKYYFPFAYTLENGETVNRRMTWTDILYIAAYDVCKNRYVYITRYPLEDYMGIYPSKISVLSTFKTIPSVKITSVDGLIENEIKNYPVVDLDLKSEAVETVFIDSLQVFNGMLKALGGDYDGYEKKN